jgi:hypothetical protein
MRSVADSPRAAARSGSAAAMHACPSSAGALPRRAEQVYLYLLPASGQARPDQRRFLTLGRTGKQKMLSPDSSQVACRKECGNQKA